MWSYNRYRDPDVQADLNKLYDTRPSTKDPYGGGSGDPHYGHDKDRDHAAVPTFDLSESGDVTAVLNKPALLNCRVKSIGNKTVSLSEDRGFEQINLFLLPSIYLLIVSLAEEAVNEILLISISALPI